MTTVIHSARLVEDGEVTDDAWVAFADGVVLPFWLDGVTDHRRRARQVVAQPAHRAFRVGEVALALGCGGPALLLRARRWRRCGLVGARDRQRHERVR